MSLFKKKKAEIKDLVLERISVVTDHFKPLNGKTVVIKAEEKKEIIFKAEKVIEGRAFGTFMIANEVDEQGHYYTAETVKKCAEWADSNKVEFNLNHKEGILKDVYLEESFYNEKKQAWQGWVNFSKNEMLVKKAADGKFHGFSIEGLGVVVEKAKEEINKAQDLKSRIMSKDLLEFTESIIFEYLRMMRETLSDEEINNTDKKGTLEINLLQLFDLVNKQISTIFNSVDIQKCELNSKNKNKGASCMELTRENKQEIVEIFKGLLEEDKKNSEAEKIEKAKDERIRKLEEVVETLKKAATKNPLNPDGGETKIEKAEEGEENGVF